jgi:membrane-associated phospholipid phosphatase
MQLLLTLALLGPPIPVEAPEPEPVEAPEPEPEAPVLAPPDAELPDIRFRLAVDLPVLIGFSAMFGISEGFKPVIAHGECRWCEPGPVARTVRGGLVWARPEPAALTSDILAYGVIPAFALTMTLAAVGTEGEWRKLHEDLIVALEAVAVSGALTNVINDSSARPRPYFVYADQPIPFDEDPDQNLSFPSSHTALAFSLATSFATVATLRGRKLAPVLWGVGLPIAGFVGYLRMAGDRGWFGDVLAGAGLGTLIGVGLPWLFHHPRTGVIPRLEARGARAQMRVVPTGNGVALVGRI